MNTQCNSIRMLLSKLNIVHTNTATNNFEFCQMKERINTHPHILHFVLPRVNYFPNSRLPVLIYRNAVDLPDQKNKSATIIQKIFLQNDWSNTWRNSIYDFHHYHSNTH